MTTYRAGETLERLMDKAFLAIHDEVAIPDRVGPDWVEGSFRTGFIAALAMVGVDRRDRGGKVTRVAIKEAVERVERAR